MDIPGCFKDAAAVAPLGESLYKPPVTSPGTQDTPGIPDEPCCHKTGPSRANPSQAHRGLAALARGPAVRSDHAVLVSSHAPNCEVEGGLAHARRPPRP